MSRSAKGLLPSLVLIVYFLQLLQDLGLVIIVKFDVLDLRCVWFYLKLAIIQLCLLRGIVTNPNTGNYNGNIKGLTTMVDKIEHELHSCINFLHTYTCKSRSYQFTCSAYTHKVLTLKKAQY